MALLQRINADRRSEGLAPVELDERASIVADAYCARQIREQTTGHFTTDGRAPYTRYSAEGLNDGISENAAAWSAERPFPEEVIPRLMIQSHEEMLSEAPPDDGHRRAILDPDATHVGIGLAWDQGEFRLAEVFLRRYIDWTHPFPRNASPSDEPWGAGRPFEGYSIDTIVVHFEPHPSVMTPLEASAHDSYALPKRRREYVPGRDLRSREARMIESRARPVSDAGGFPVQHDGSFSFSVEFPDGPGLYTVVVWVRRESDGRRIAASNVSIRVGAPASILTGSP